MNEMELVLKAEGVIAFTDRSLHLKMTAQDQDAEQQGINQGFVILTDNNSKTVELRKYRGKFIGLGKNRAMVFSVPIEQLPALKNQTKFNELTEKLGDLRVQDVKFVDLLEVRGGINDVGSYSASMYSPDTARFIAYISKIKQQSSNQTFRQRCTAAITDELIKGRLVFDLNVDYLADKLKFTPSAV